MQRTLHAVPRAGSQHRLRPTPEERRSVVLATVRERPVDIALFDRILEERTIRGNKGVLDIFENWFDETRQWRGRTT